MVSARMAHLIQSHAAEIAVRAIRQTRDRPELSRLRRLSEYELPAPLLSSAPFCRATKSRRAAPTGTRC